MWGWLVLAAALAAAPAATPPVKKVLIFAVDGCRPDALRKARTPTLNALVEDGSASFDVRTTQYSDSGPGWSTVLGGIWAGKHRVFDNTFVGNNLARFPPLFARLRQKVPGARSALLTSWAPMREHLAAGTYRADLITTPDPEDYALQDELVTERAVQLLASEDPAVLLVYFINVDETGHARGFSQDNRRYITAIEKVDQQIATVLAALRRRATYAAEDWLIITTTDHGGTGRGHGQDIPEHTTTFLIVSGASARKGPATRPVAAVDVAATALAHLLGGAANLVPGWGLDGRVFGLME